MTDTCYLCGKEITGTDIKTDDHTVPKLLINRKQPKVKGFDYGGVLPTHQNCNNEFGAELYCIKALKLIPLLHNADCVSQVQLNGEPTLLINSDYFKEFTQQDLTFFKIIDVRNNTVAELSSPNFFPEKPKTNPRNDALFTSLAVLTKSAAALLVARLKINIPKHWKILAVSYFGANERDIDKIFDEILGKTKPFDIGVKVWLPLLPFDSGDRLAVYRVQNILVIFLFKFSKENLFWNSMIEKFPNARHLYFEGSHLNELINYKWKKAEKL